MTAQVEDVQAAGGQLLAFVERIERVQEELRATQEDRKEIYSELKGVGFDVAVVKKIVAQRKRDRDEVQEEEALMDTYLRALEQAQR